MGVIVVTMTYDSVPGLERCERTTWHMKINGLPFHLQRAFVGQFRKFKVTGPVEKRELWINGYIEAAMGHDACKPPMAVATECLDCISKLLTIQSINSTSTTDAKWAIRAVIWTMLY